MSVIFRGIENIMDNGETKKQILMNDFRAQWKTIHDSAIQAVERVGKSGWLVLGKEVASFESELASFCSLPFAVGCGSGLDALEISLRCLSLKPGDKVLTTPLSAFATSLAIIRAGGVPVFVDVDDSGLLDLALAGQVLEKQNDIRFMVPVHLYGHVLNLIQLEDLKKRFDLSIVEDCAQVIGGKSHNIPAGSVGDCAAMSFYPTKNLGAMGDGGAVLTKSASYAEHAKCLRDYGQISKYEHAFRGLNSRLDELHAAILHDALMPLLTKFTKKRKEIASRYCSEINNPLILIPPKPEGSESVWHLFPVLIKGNRRLFQNYLTRESIAFGIHYPILIPDQKALNNTVGGQLLTSLRNALFFADQEISLPIHPYLTEQQIEQVIFTCNAWQG